MGDIEFRRTYNFTVLTTAFGVDQNYQQSTTINIPNCDFIPDEVVLRHVLFTPQQMPVNTGKTFYVSTNLINDRYLFSYPEVIYYISPNSHFKIGKTVNNQTFSLVISEPEEITTFDGTLGVLNFSLEFIKYKRDAVEL